MSDRPPVPVRTPTPTLDAFWAKRGRGSARFEAQPMPAVGERDFALEAYDRAFDIFLGEAIPAEELATVSKADVLAARTYPVLFVQWCTDYNGGFPPGQGKNEQAATLDELAKHAVVADPPIIPASVVAEPITNPAASLPPQTYVPLPPSAPPKDITPFPPVIVPTPKPSWLSRLGASLRSFYLHHIA